jgi:hypothetical protein
VNQHQVNQPVVQQKKRRTKKKNVNPAGPGKVGMVASAAGQMILPQQFVQPIAVV